MWVQDNKKTLSVNYTLKKQCLFIIV